MPTETTAGSAAGHEHHHAARAEAHAEQSLNVVALSATLHCLTGCAIARCWG